MKDKKWLRDFLKPYDRLRYLLWRAFRSQQSLTVQLQTGKSLLIRPTPATDLATAYEIFVAQAYAQPKQVPNLSPKLVVDVGANVGYSVIHWMQIYPTTHLIAFEPHPTHLQMLHRHLEVNKITNQVDIIRNAASNQEGQAFLTNHENESVIVDKNEDGCLPVKTCDFFTKIGTQAIDLLKMDIEGGEYAILGDRRFEALNIKAIVLEWHNTAKVVDGYQWCLQRLTSLGFSVIDGQLKYENSGILWAWKNA